MNKSVLHKITYGLYIISSGQNGKFNGQIGNTLFQVTSDPPTIASSINKENYTHELIKLSRKFTVSILSQAAPMAFIGLFGFKSGREVNKLKDVKIKRACTHKAFPYCLCEGVQRHRRDFGFFRYFQIRILTVDHAC